MIIIADLIVHDILLGYQMQFLINHRLYSNLFLGDVCFFDEINRLLFSFRPKVNLSRPN